MTDKTVITISCAICGEILPSEWVNELNPNQVCPHCKGTEKNIKLSIEEALAVDIHDQMKARLQDPTMPSRKKTRVEVIAGDDLRKSDGKWMKKERVIDKTKDLYKEIVIDPLLTCLPFH